VKFHLQKGTYSCRGLRTLGELGSELGGTSWLPKPQARTDKWLAQVAPNGCEAEEDGKELANLPAKKAPRIWEREFREENAQNQS
jgi:hypothetical protein